MATETEETEHAYRNLVEAMNAQKAGAPYVVNYDDIRSILTACEAREADSKRLNYLETLREDVKDMDHSTICDWRIESRQHATVREAIDAALSGTETTP